MYVDVIRRFLSLIFRHKFIASVMSENVQDCVLLDSVMLCTASDRLWCL